MVRESNKSGRIIVLDGPVGTELLARGMPTPPPAWSGRAIEEAPELLAAVHADYARAGATAHTTCTYRTTERVFPDDWERLARRAVEIARSSVGDAMLLGSIAPLEDDDKPQLSPALTDPDGTREEHAQLARVLVESGCDALLCETFTTVGEALLATEAALEAASGAGVPVWTSISAGHRADLMTAETLAEGTKQAAELGADGVLVNCVPASRSLEYVRAIAEAVGTSGPQIGVYANAGREEEGLGWGHAGSPEAATRYGDLAETWVRAGATIVGGCCGTGVGHVRELSRRFG